MRSLLATVLLVGGWPSASLADECASYGPKAHLSTPVDGARVAANAHLHVGLYVSCGGVEGGPRHQFRLLDADGKEVALHERRKPPTARCQRPTCQELELVPRALLAPGAYRLEVRRPVDEHTLGAWSVLGHMTALDRIDAAAPKLEGIVEASAEPVEGTAFLSPCQAVPAWELRTTVEFEAAEDGPTDHDELLYALDRQPPAGGPWSEVAGFRPDGAGGSRRSYSFDSDDWEQSWRYRIRVHDAAGHETIGARTMVVTAPAEPTEPVPGAVTDERRDPLSWAGDGGGCASCRLAPRRSRSGAAVAWLGMLLAAWLRRRARHVVEHHHGKCDPGAASGGLRRAARQQVGDPHGG